MLCHKRHLEASPLAVFLETRLFIFPWGQIPLGSSRLDTTRHVRRVEPMHFVCVELVEHHGSIHSTRQARRARHDERDRRDSQLSLLCNMYKSWYVTYSLIYWSLHLFNLFHLTEQIGFVSVRAQTTKLVQASTVACSSSAMLEQTRLVALGTLITTGSTRRTCRVVSRRDVTSQVEFGPNLHCARVFFVNSDYYCSLILL